MWWLSPGNNRPFQDAVICGAISGAVAWILGDSFVLWAMLGALAGPVFVRAADRLLEAKALLPGPRTEADAFFVFALCVAAAVIAVRLFS